MSKPRLTIPLDYPVTVLGQRHEALHLRRLKGRDLAAVATPDSFDFERGVNLMARLANVPVAVVMAMHDDDVVRVGRFINAGLGA